MSSKVTIREGAKHLVRMFQKLPEERIKHIVSFKKTQMDRFKRIAGLPVENGIDNPAKTPSIAEIKDIMNRTSGPLGLQKDLLRKMQAAIPQDQFTEEGINTQIKSLQSLVDNKYKNYYEVGDKLYRPAGNPQYYERILAEITGKGQETFLSGLRTVIFGK